MTQFNPDTSDSAIDVLLLSSSRPEFDAPVHCHNKGQLVMPVTGSMVCEVENEIWMVPAGSAVWIPAGLMHRNAPAASATFSFVFFEPEKTTLPDKCCTLSITPLIKEMVLHLGALSPEEAAHDNTAMLTEVLLNMLGQMPTEKLNFALTSDTRLRKVATALIANPGDRRTVRQWADCLAMSEKTFSRLVLRETGMTFGLWRKQLHIVVSLQKLLEGESVQSVSEVLGYESVSAFITMFKKTLGKSPKRYISSSPPPASQQIDRF